MGLFNINGGFWKFMNRFLDVLLLNFLWLIFSLPIFTMGAATCAAFQVSLKMVDEQEGYVSKMFIKAFKENFKQGTLMGLITLPSIYALYILWQIVIKADDINFLVILGVILGTAIVIAMNLYTYPMIARYDNSLKNIIKNSTGICIQYFKKTLILVVLVGIEVLMILWNKVTVFVGILIGPEFIIFTISAISMQIFRAIENSSVN